MSKNKVRVVHEYDLSKKVRENLEGFFEFLIGDESGDWYVVDEDIALGRYVEKSRAQEHADTLNSVDESDLPVNIDQLLADIKEMIGPNEED